MLNWMKKVASTMAAVAFLACVPSVMASTVTYTTKGSFTATPTDTATTSGTGSTLTSSSGSMSLDFLNFTSPAVVVPSLNANLGKFTLNFDPASDAFLGGDTFALTITQTAPAGGPGTSIATVMGSVTFTPNATPNDTTGTLTVAFNSGNPIFLVAGGQTYSYKIKTFKSTINTNAPGAAVGVLRGEISVVPLPKTASMGLAMFGALGVVAGGAALRRRSIAIA